AGDALWPAGGRGAQGGDYQHRPDRPRGRPGGEPRGGEGRRPRGVRRTLVRTEKPGRDGVRGRQDDLRSRFGGEMTTARRDAGRTGRVLVGLFAVVAVSTATAQDKAIAIRGGTVIPVDGAPIQNGTVVIRGGKIVAVGANVSIPSGAEIVEARGKYVLPGLVDAMTSI